MISEKPCFTIDVIIHMLYILTMKQLPTRQTIIDKHLKICIIHKRHRHLCISRHNNQTTTTGLNKLEPHYRFIVHFSSAIMKWQITMARDLHWPVCSASGIKPFWKMNRIDDGSTVCMESRPKCQGSKFWPRTVCWAYCFRITIVMLHRICLTIDSKIYIF